MRTGIVLMGPVSIALQRETAQNEVRQVILQIDVIVSMTTELKGATD